MSFVLDTVYKAVDKFSQPVKLMERTNARFADKTAAKFAKVNRVLRKMNRPLSMLTKKFGNLASLVGGFSLGMIVKAGADAIIDLDKNISAASAKFGVFDRSSDVFKKIRNKALDMGATTEFTAGQAAEGMKNLATAGFSAQQAIAGLGTVLNLATATQAELGTASNVAAKSLAAFGLRSKDPVILSKNLNMVSDTLNKLITSSGFGNLDEVLTTLGASGASARAAGLDIQTWAAAVGTGVTNAIDASSAGSQLNMALTKLAKPSAEATKLISKMGIKVADAQGNYRDFFDILQDVEKGTKGMGTQQKAAALSTIFGARSQKIINVLLKDGIESVKQYRKEIFDATGITQKMAGFMRSGLSGAIAAMKSGFEAIAIAVGDVFQPEIDMLIKKLTDVARGSKSWIVDNKGLIKSVFSIVKFVAKYMAIVKAITIAFSIWTAIIKVATLAQIVFNTAMSANIIGIIIIAIIALVAGIVALIRNWSSIVDWVKTSNNWFAKLIRFSLIPIIAIFKGIGKAIDWVKERWAAITNAFKTGGFMAGIKAIGKSILSFLLKPVELVLQALSRIPGAGGEKFKGKLTEIQAFRATLEGKDPAAQSAAIEPVNTVATSTSVQTERFEQIKEQRLGIDINNRSDKDINLTNPSLIPVTSNTF